MLVLNTIPASVIPLEPTITAAWLVPVKSLYTAGATWFLLPEIATAPVLVMRSLSVVVVVPPLVWKTKSPGTSFPPIPVATSVNISAAAWLQSVPSWGYHPSVPILSPAIQAAPAEDLDLAKARTIAPSSFDVLMKCAPSEVAFWTCSIAWPPATYLLALWPIKTFPSDVMRSLSSVEPPLAVLKYKSAAFVDAPPLAIASPSAAPTLSAPFVSWDISIASPLLVFWGKWTLNLVLAPDGAAVVPMRTWPSDVMRSFSVAAVLCPLVMNTKSEP